MPSLHKHLMEGLQQAQKEPKVAERQVLLHRIMRFLCVLTGAPDLVVENEEEQKEVANGENEGQAAKAGDEPSPLSPTSSTCTATPMTRASMAKTAFPLSQTAASAHPTTPIPPVPAYRYERLATHYADHYREVLDFRLNAQSLMSHAICAKIFVLTHYKWAFREQEPNGMHLRTLNATCHALNMLFWDEFVDSPESQVFKPVFDYVKDVGLKRIHGALMRAGPSTDFDNEKEDEDEAQPYPVPDLSPKEAPTDAAAATVIHGGKNGSQPILHPVPLEPPSPALLADFGWTLMDDFVSVVARYYFHYAPESIAEFVAHLEEACPLPESMMSDDEKSNEVGTLSKADRLFGSFKGNVWGMSNPYIGHLHRLNYSDIVCREVASQIEKLRQHEPLLLEYVGRCVELTDVIPNAGPRARQQLQEVLYSYSTPGGPRYASRRVRERARDVLEILFPFGKRTRKVIAFAFRVFHQHGGSWTKSFVLYWLKTVTKTVKGLLGQFKSLLGLGKKKPEKHKE